MITDGAMHGFQVFDSDEVDDAYEIIFDSGLIYDTYDEANEAGETTLQHTARRLATALLSSGDSV